MKKPIVYNLAGGEQAGGLLTADVVEFLNEYEDHWGESTSGKIAYGAARGVAYGVTIPVLVIFDALGILVAAPVTLVSLISKSVSNTKIRKLIRALEKGEKLPMDVNRVHRLREIL